VQSVAFPVVHVARSKAWCIELREELPAFLSLCPYQNLIVETVGVGKACVDPDVGQRNDVQRSGMTSCRRGRGDSRIDFGRVVQ